MDLTDDLRISRETIASIKARLLADTNAGTDPNDPAYADTAPGSFWDDLNGCATLEFDRVYDRTNEVVAAAIPALASGPWLDAWASSVRLTRNEATKAGGEVTFSGADGTIVPVGKQVSTVQTSADSEAITFVTTAAGTIAGGAVTLAVEALEEGSQGNVPSNTVTALESPLSDPAVTVTNAAAMTGGSDEESDERLQSRIETKFAGAGGAGNVDDYVVWALDQPGVGYVTVFANTPTVGHVTVQVTDVNNDPMPAAAVAALQERLDPSTSSAQGAGQAPAGATVHVGTPALVTVNVVAVVELEPGYSLDGANGTIALRQEITDSLRRYIDGLPVGGDVVFNKVVAAIVDVPGVIDAPAVSAEPQDIDTGQVAVMQTTPTIVLA